ncbi:MAG TPA: HAD-IB family hydrolase [Candidatus Saccharimonadales bacterium]|nr:HAD-IB family hydrolase [Candidatus Saccharimonadales bacterium]
MSQPQRKFAVFDIDGTLFRWQLFSEIVFELIESGDIPQSVRKSVDAKMDEWRNRAHRHSFHDYELAVVDAFFPHLNGLKASSLATAADTVLARSGARVYAYTRGLIDQLRKEGYTLIAISGSQDEIVQRFAKLWKFDIALGQMHEQKEGVYTGTIPGNKLLILQKGTILKNIVREHNLSWQRSVAVGDSLSDAAMLKLVERPIAFNPNDELFEAARANGWNIVIERKNMIYELEQNDNGTYLLVKADTR